MNCAGWYFLILSILNFTSMVLFIIMTFPKTFIFLEFYLLLICFVYWFYMFWVEINNSSDVELQANFVTKQKTDFLADIVFKYLYIILLTYGLSYVFVYIIDEDTQKNIYDKYIDDLGNTEKVVLNICKWYNKVMIPLALTIDFCCRKRNRVVNPFFDLLILIISAIGLCAYDIAFYKYYDSDDYDHSTRLILIVLVTKFILFFISYVYYDFFLYKVNNIPGSYTLCDNSNDPRLVVQE